MRELFQWHRGDGHRRIIGVILDHYAECAQVFLADDPAPWAHQQIFALRNGDTITRTYGGDSLPSCWLVDANGVIIEGNIPVEKIEAAIERLMR